MRFFVAVLIIVCILALAATFGAIFVGIKSFDGLVVEHPYETGLKWDELRKREAGQKAAGTASAGTRTDCDIQHGSCSRTTPDGTSVVFDILPRPAAAMSELTFMLALSRNGKPVSDVSSVLLDLSMPGMYMGQNRPVLRKVADGRYEGKGVITRCMSGEKTWQAKVSMERPGRTDTVHFVFEVK